jgi:hypothetical protein
MNDLDMANEILRHPDVYPWIRDDFSPPVEDFNAAPMLSLDSVYFLNPLPGCLFILAPFVTSTMFEGHTAVLPESRGKLAISAGKLAIQWMFDHTPCERIVGFFPDTNRRALMGAIHMGMKRTHRLPGGIRIDGQAVDLVMVEVAKENKSCR